MERYSATQQLPLTVLVAGFLIAASTFARVSSEPMSVTALRIGWDLPIEGCRSDGSWRSTRTSQQLTSLRVTPVIAVLQHRQIRLAVVLSNTVPTGRALSQTSLKQVSVWASIRWMSEDALHSWQDCVQLASRIDEDCAANVTKAGGLCNVAPRVLSPPHRADKVELNVTTGYVQDPCAHSMAELEAGCQTGECLLHCRLSRLSMNLISEPSLHLISMNVIMGGYQIKSRLNGLYGRYISIRNVTGHRRHLALVQINGNPPVMDCQSKHCCRMTPALSRRRETNTITLTCVGSPQGTYASHVTARNTVGTTSAMLVLQSSLMLVHKNFHETRRWRQNYKRRFTVQE